MASKQKQTLEELGNKIERSLPEISKIAADADTVGNITARNLVIRRIFNEGKRTDGASIGNYVVGPYKNKRFDEGKQVNYIDLQFNGDLFNSIQVGQLNGKPAVGIINQKRADISGYIDGKYGMIFQASNEERSIAMNDAREFAFERIKKLMKSWS